MGDKCKKTQKTKNKDLSTATTRRNKARKQETIKRQQQRKQIKLAKRAEMLGNQFEDLGGNVNLVKCADTNPRKAATMFQRGIIWKREENKNQ